MKVTFGTLARKACFGPLADISIDSWPDKTFCDYRKSSIKPQGGLFTFMQS